MPIILTVILIIIVLIIVFSPILFIIAQQFFNIFFRPILRYQFLFLEILVQVYNFYHNLRVKFQIQ